jgi:DNA-directed RNA polymerase subunit L
MEEKERMELELLGKDEDSMTIKLVGEDHTLCNVLRKTLHEDKYVIAASYAIEHPLLEHPKFYVKVKKGRSSRRALTDAAGRIIENCDELRSELLKALK